MQGNNYAIVQSIKETKISHSIEEGGPVVKQ
jgi:hypothetical protein